MFVAVGTGYSFGALVLPASRDLGTSVGAVSGVFAVSVMVFFLASAPAGILADRWGPRVVLAGGALALSAGLATTAAASSPWVLYAGHGVLVGAAMSTTFVPLVAGVGASFERHRLVAVGVAVSGIGVGTLVMAPVVAWLIGALGWRGAYALLAGVGGVLLLGCAALFSARSRPTGPGGDAGGARLRDLLREPSYRVLYVAQALLAVALFVPFAHLPAFAEEAGSAPVTAAGLVGVIGAASVVGRLALGPVATRVGLLRTYQGCYAAIGVSFVPWLLPAPTYPLLLVHALVFGLGYGGFVALLPGVVAERFGVERLGGMLGVIHTSHVLGAAAGPLALGLLVASLGYGPVALGALVCGCAAAGVLGVLRRTERRTRER